MAPLSARGGDGPFEVVPENGKPETENSELGTGERMAGLSIRGPGFKE
jgi:hypothetical protein